MNLRSLRRRAALLLAPLALAAACTTTPVVEDKPPVETPEPAPQKPTLPAIPQELVQSSGVEEFDVNGLHVILKRTPNKPVVALDLFVQGGLTAAADQPPGIENLAVRVAVSGGTQAHPRDTFTSAIEAMGSGINASAGRDASTFSMGCVRPYFNDTFALFAEVLTQPAFDPQQLEVERARVIEGIKSIEDNPDAFVSDLVSRAHFQNHPYAQRVEGTVEAAQALTREQLQAYYGKLLQRERLLLVVVGDIDRPTLEKAITDHLANLPTGAGPAPAPPAVPPRSSSLEVANKPNLPTNYILGYYNAPAADHPDYVPLLVTSSILRDRLFEEVRTRRNLTYAVSSGVGNRKVNLGYLYVTTVDPKTTLPVMMEEVRKLAEEPLDPKVLKDIVEVFLTRHYMGQETNNAQAETLASYELLSDDWSRSLVFLDTVKTVTPEDVQRIASTYMKDIHWAFVGKPDAADPAVFTIR